MTRNRMLRKVLQYVFSLVLGCVAAVLLVGSQGVDVSQLGSLVVRSTVGSEQAVLDTIRWSTPIMISGLAFLVAARAGVFNLGVEGQAYVGGLVSAILGTTVHLPAVLLLPLCLIAGGVAGALFAFPAAWLRQRWGANEIVTTLMLNYVAVLLTTLIVRAWFLTYTNGVVSETIATATVSRAARIPAFSGSSSSTWAFVVAVALCVVVALVMIRSRFGFGVTSAGRSESFARFAGFNVNSVRTRAFLISGALGGLVGAVEVLGPQGRFVAGFADSFSFDGVLVAIIGGLSPIGVIAASLFYGGLTNTSYIMSSFTNVTSYMVMLVLAIFVILFNVDPLRYIRRLRLFARKARATDE